MSRFQEPDETSVRAKAYALAARTPDVNDVPQGWMRALHHPCRIPDNFFEDLLTCGVSLSSSPCDSWEDASYPVAVLLQCPSRSRKTVPIRPKSGRDQIVG